MPILPIRVNDPLRSTWFRVGETRAIAHELQGDENFQVSSGTIDILDAAGTAVVTNGAVVVPEAPSKKQLVSYLWNTTGVTKGEHTYYLKLVLDTGETVYVRGEASVWPVTSKLDRWVTRINQWIMDAPRCDAALRLLTGRMYSTAAEDAVRRLGELAPKVGVKDYTLTSGTYEYALPLAADPDGAWVKRKSRIVSIEFPVDDTAQIKYYLQPHDWRLDEERSVWAFVRETPKTGEKARFRYTIPWTLDHDTDNVLESWFDLACQYAAGKALLQAGNAAVYDSAPGPAAEFVRSQQREFRSQGERFVKEAESRLGRAQHAALAPWVEWEYLPHHGKAWFVE